MLTLDKLCKDFLESKRAKRSPLTVEAYKLATRKFTEFVNVRKGTKHSAQARDVTRDMIEAWVTHQHETLDRVTVINRLAAVRELTKYGIRQRVWAVDPCEGLETLRRPKRLPRPFRAPERDALMRLPLSDQDAALRAILYYGGLRAQEVCNLRFRDLAGPWLWPDGRQNFARLTVRGKGSKERSVPLHPDAWAAIERYALGKAVEDRAESSFLFAHANGGQWHTRMLRRRVERWGKAAGVERTVPHKFRHTMATVLVEANRRLDAIRDRLGHASVATTEIYLQVADQEADDVAGAMPSYAEKKGEGDDRRVL